MKKVGTMRSSIVAVALASVFVITGCSPGGSNDNNPGGVGKYGDDGSNDPIYVAEIRADEGEDLLAPASLDSSLEKFEASIRANPSNPRAQFWRSYLRIQLELKGFVTRVQPLFAGLPNGENRYERFADMMLKDMTPDTRQFYLSGPADITTPELFQEWLDRFVLRLVEARESYSALKAGREFQIRAPRAYFGSTNSPDSKKKCQSKWGPIVVQPADCDSAYFEAYLNRADLEVLTSAISTFQTQLTVLNAWRMDPVIAGKFAEHTYPISATEMMTWINEGNGKLRANAAMKKSKTAVRDFAVSYQ
ncbi:MAG: hypothetical protein AAB250_06385, partial [Bdellovibrionota bacterium]